MLGPEDPGQEQLANTASNSGQAVGQGAEVRAMRLHAWDTADGTYAFLPGEQRGTMRDQSPAAGAKDHRQCGGLGSPKECGLSCVKCIKKATWLWTDGCAKFPSRHSSLSWWVETATDSPSSQGHMEIERGLSSPRALANSCWHHN